MAITAPNTVAVKPRSGKKVRVIYRPQNFDPQLNGVMRCPMPTASENRPGLTKIQKGNQAYSLAGPNLVPGLNVLEEEEAELLKATAWYDTFDENNILEFMDEIESEDGPTDTTLDYQPKNAIEIVRNCLDIEWLRICNTKEADGQRQGVKKAIATRISELMLKERELEEARR